MDWSAFSTKWFMLYYSVLALIFFGLGCYSLIKTAVFRDYLLEQADQQKPPAALRNLLKYFFLFTIPTLILSFIPFSLTELLFSLWSLIIIYATGIQLVRWEQTRLLIKDKSDTLSKSIGLSGAIMVALSLVILALGYIRLTG